MQFLIVNLFPSFTDYAIARKYNLSLVIPNADNIVIIDNANISMWFRNNTISTMN